MTENNYNIIKPVDGLGNIAAMESADRRQKRKKQENAKKNLPRNVQNQQNIEQNSLDQDEKHSIDYRA